ncbi:MAG: HD domain-containing protein [Bradyrhizobium sp.]|uniref:HD-GYP domain-containing protein n=1 Tax=Bradyrhizobium sp. TaxID=376 RepID=UPI0025BB4B65|nr:HD domain-containing phosphohydrolase [Bradyrhizobium sp.]MBI5262872.1 HD domain-containing protein [Bradyrhizobium sp.]
MFVHVLADSSARLSGVRTILERKHDISSELLGRTSLRPDRFDAVVVRADLRVIEIIPVLKKALAALEGAKRRIFLVEQATHLGVSQAHALGATVVLTGPVNRPRLLAALADDLPSDTTCPAEAAEEDEPMATAATAIASMFTAAVGGTTIDVAGAKEAGSRIADHISERGLSDWLATVRRHHEGTYQHCLLVTGVAIDFGLSLGVARDDLERLYSAAIFHDIGKARIPLAVLDKPGRLDAAERALIETHPVVGYDVLRDQGNISPEILDAVRHHHEYLDGSGYPDALCAESLSDVVRMLTISDIFAALIECRPYKRSMPRGQAYEVLCSMHGKLEKPLVAAFREVALSR